MNEFFLIIKALFDIVIILLHFIILVSKNDTNDTLFLC
jgi:hypothetical protein